MSYIGNTVENQNYVPAIDYFNGDGSTVAFTLSRPVASVAAVQAVISNVPQNPGSAFTVSGSTITFTSAPPSGTANIYVYYTSPNTQVVQPGQGTVGSSQMASGVNLTAGTITFADASTISSNANPQVTVYGSGSGTYTTPTNAKYLYVRMIGGGGAGGSGGSGCGGGGGAGGYLEGQITSPSATYSYAVGGAGGTTTFGSALFTCTGGAAGSASTVQAFGGAGGSATGGALNLTGATGGYGWAAAPYYSGGIGAATPFGGSAENSGTNAGNGLAATSYGGGGSGGVGGGAAGNGMGGLIIVTAYF